MYLVEFIAPINKIYFLPVGIYLEVRNMYAYICGTIAGIKKQK